jgi:hypothetical protein
MAIKLFSGLKTKIYTSRMAISGTLMPNNQGHAVARPQGTQGLRASGPNRGPTPGPTGSQGQGYSLGYPKPAKESQQRCLKFEPVSLKNPVQCSRHHRSTVLRPNPCAIMTFL